MAQARSARAINETYSTDRENEVSKIFIISLGRSDLDLFIQPLLPYLIQLMNDVLILIVLTMLFYPQNLHVEDETTTT